MSLWVKICGVTSEEAVEAAVGAGADAVGLVFFAPSPRHLALGRAAVLARAARGRVEVVALTVDADDEALGAIAEAVSPDRFQLHGHEEPARVAEIRRRYGRPVMKAVGLAEPSDLALARAHAETADTLLLDAKPPSGAALPGGNGLAFDWTMLEGLDLAKNFVLSGGLDPGNVVAAVRAARPLGVDVSSGVERAPGLKDPAMIAAFVTAARAAEPHRSEVPR